jgi:hypothetical protein
MQNKSFTLDGSGKAKIVAPCPCEAVDIICAAHTFTFQYARRADEIQTGTNQTAGDAIGDATSAAQWSATYFEFRAESSRFKPWNTGDVIGYILGTAADAVGVRPRRPGGS